ncbi:hypothetical protein LTR05_003705 [Lithohypha guttulata]|uniref:Uncharacterized protein n=1 Tax=Lithohypha guttulata TaxID=1690604 RepID=A0AAN7T1G9_9EURO|nr:hypothetical protein LTR05_003705 [Lithohypha guttulata]
MKACSLVLGFAALLTVTVASPITAVNENAVETPSVTNSNPANVLAVAQPQASQCIGQWWPW